MPVVPHMFEVDQVLEILAYYYGLGLMFGWRNAEIASRMLEAWIHERRE